MADLYDAVTIGAGIIGSAVAREFARAGLKVAIVEDGVPAGATTSAGMGHLVVMDDSPAQLALTKYSRDLWHAERESLPEDTAFNSCGTIWVAADDEEMQAVRTKHDVYRAQHIAADVLTAEQLSTLEPNLRTSLAGGLFVPDDGVLRPPIASRFFLAEALRYGAVLFSSKALTAASGRVALADGTHLDTKRIVLATGTDCALLPALPIHKRKGHLAITEPAPGFLRHQIVELGYLKSAHALVSDSVAFNVQPRAAGQVVIGSSRQYDAEDTGIDDPICQSMMERAISFMPGLAALSIERIWTGFRAAVPDKLPLIGPAAGLSDDKTLWLAAGFEGLGTTNAPGAARLLLDMVRGSIPAIEATPFLPARFQGKATISSGNLSSALKENA